MTRKIDLRKPCLNCTFETGRTLNCHDTCKYYIDNKAWEEVIKEKVRRESEYVEYVSSAICRFNGGNKRVKKSYSSDPRKIER